MTRVKKNQQLKSFAVYKIYKIQNIVEKGIHSKEMQNNFRKRDDIYFIKTFGDRSYTGMSLGVVAKRA